MRDQMAETIVGFVVLVVAGVFLVFALGSSSATGGGYTVRSVFPSVDGLRVGADVRVNGVSVGSVRAIELDGDERPVVAFSVERGLDIPSDSQAAIRSDGLLGGAFLDLELGANEGGVSAGDTLEALGEGPAAGGFLSDVFSSSSGVTGDYAISVAFPNVNGLRLGADVRINGQAVGQVTDIGLDTSLNYQPYVTFTVVDSIEIPTDSSFVVQNESLLGGTYLNVLPGSSGDVIEPGAFADELGDGPDDVFALLNALITASVD